MSQPAATSSPKKAKQPTKSNKICFACLKATDRGRPGLKCNTCLLSVHDECTTLDKEMLEMYKGLQKKGEDAYACHVCKSAVKSLKSQADLNTRDIKSLKEKNEALETKVGKHEEEMEKMNTEMSEMKARLAEVENGLKKNVDSNQQKSTGLISNQVIQEMNQRKQKAKNIILQGVPELNSDVPKEESNAYDKARIKEIFKELDMPSPPDNSLTTATRIGGRSKNKTRPIKLQLCDKTTADKVIGCASRLKNAKDKNNQKVRIEPDLTKGQREAESNVYESCNSKNLSRPQEMIDQRKAHKVVGKKGRKWIAVVELKEKEVVNESGKIMLVQQEETPNKRGVTRDRSRGGTPDAEKKTRTDTEAITSDEED